MPRPNVLILRAPGTNCDVETAFAFEQAGATTERLHVNRLLENKAELERFQILCVPGGFSYGDDVGAGRILGNQLLHHLVDRLVEFREADKLILGICNGFQVLLRCGILLEAEGPAEPAATLTWNDSGRFEDRWVRLKTVGTSSVFLGGIDWLELPIAHAEGKFVTAGAEVFEQLDSLGQLVLRYARLDGSGNPAEEAVPYPDNPNGSMGNVAGVCDRTGRVLGLMPHPERHLDPVQHPRWTRRDEGATGGGAALFANAVRYFQ